MATPTDIELAFARVFPIGDENVDNVLDYLDFVSDMDVWNDSSDGASKALAMAGMSGKRDMYREIIRLIKRGRGE